MNTLGFWAFENLVFIFVGFFKFSHDFKQFNITYEEITDKVEIGRGRFGCVYK